MKIQHNEEADRKATILTLSESNVKELYGMLMLWQINQDRSRIANAPYLFKQQDGESIVVQIQTDAIHYANES